MKGRFYLGGGVLFVLGIVLLAIQMRPRAMGEPKPTPPESSKPTPAMPQSAEKPVPEMPTSSDPDTTLHLNGTVVPYAKTAFSVRMPMKIDSVKVVEGEIVPANTLLVTFDDSDRVAQSRTAQEAWKVANQQTHKAEIGKSAQIVKADADISTALAGLRQAQVKLQQAGLAKEALNADIETEKRLADEGVKKAEEGVKLAERTRKSLEELAKVGGVARNDLEAARNQERVALSDLATARTQRMRLDAGPSKELSYRIALAEKDMATAREGVRQAEEGVANARKAKEQLVKLADSDIRVARAGQAQAGAVWESTVTETRSYRLVSGFAGVVTGLQARSGEVAQPGATLLTLLSTQNPHLEALVTARHLALLKVGSKGVAQFDTLPNRTFVVLVKELPRVAEPDGRTFRVKFEFVGGANVLPGQTAHLTFSSTSP